jgi:hypothetical protein
MGTQRFVHVFFVGILAVCDAAATEWKDPSPQRTSPDRKNDRVDGDSGNADASTQVCGCRLAGKSPGPSSRCITIVSTHRLSLNPTDFSVPTVRKPIRW